MKKLLFLPDQHSLHNGAIEFACDLAKMSSSALTGVFLENLKRKEVMTTTMEKDIMYIQTVTTTNLKENEPQRSRFGHLIHQFKEACKQRGTACTIHQDQEAPLQELLYETRFADALIVESSHTFDSVDGEDSLSSHTIQLLAGAECPVIITPPHFHQIDELVFAYDGSARSVQAMKQFTYLFPELTNRKLVVVEVHDTEETDARKRSRMLLDEWLNIYFPFHTFLEMEGDPEARLLAYTMHRNHAIIIMGAYGRNSLSRLFKSSTADSILKMVPAPVFIAHS